MKYPNNELRFRITLNLPSVENNNKKDERSVEVVIPLDGKTVQTSTDDFIIELSKSAGYLEGNIVIWYEYDKVNNLITFYGNEWDSDGAIRLLLRSVGVVDSIVISAFKKMGNVFHESLRQVLRSANDQIIKHAENSGMNVMVRTPKPDLGPLFVDEILTESFNEENLNDLEEFKMILESVDYGIGKLDLGTKFANVIGSTKDPKLASNWLKLWRQEFDEPECCSSLDYDKDFECNEDIKHLVGGHCILGTTAKVVSSGSNKVFIIPICKAHNANDDIHMAVMKNKGRVIWLEGYMRTRRL